MTDSEVPEIPAEIVPVPPPAAPPRFFAYLARRPFVVLAMLGLLLWLPGILSLPALDRDESRFAQSSRQMVETGDLVDIRLGHVPRYKKPVGIYWLQSAATGLAGLGDDSHIWTYRLPSLLGAISAAWLTAWCALAFLEAEAALVAGLLMLGSVLLAAEATIATTDAVLLACVLAVQGVLLRVYRKARQADAWSVLLSVATMLAFVPTLTAGAGPRLAQLWVTERLKPLVAAATLPGDPPPALAGYEEPSMLFAFGKDVLLTDGAGAAEAGAKSGGLALVEDAEQGAFLARLAELQADAEKTGDLRGFNYSRGRNVHVTIYRVAQLREIHQAP